MLESNITLIRTGTMAEIQCMDGSQPDGENLITCLSDGEWDNDVPECIFDEKPESTSTEPVFILEIPVDETIINEIESPKEAIQQEDKYPNKAFWKSLQTYLFFGCHGLDSNKRSHLCDYYPSNVTNLNQPETTEGQSIQNTDQKLIDLFQSTLASAVFEKITIENLFQFILYQDESFELDKYDRAMEDSFRLTLCFYLNLISNEKLNESEKMPLGSISIESQEDIGEHIKVLLRRIVQPAYEKFRDTYLN